MIGAIIGSYIGSQNARMSPQIEQKEFPLFSRFCFVSTDIIMILATAKALIDYRNDGKDLHQKILREYVNAYDNNSSMDWSNNFGAWTKAKDHEPYNSFGIMAATKVVPVGFMANSLDDVRNLSRKITEMTHNHPEGIKGAEAVSVAVFLAKSGIKAEQIKNYISKNYYEMNYSPDDIRKSKEYSFTCQKIVPYALMCFFESKNFEEAIRNAVLLGGNSSAIACICGAVAEAYYGVPNSMLEKLSEILNNEQIEICNRFYDIIPSNVNSDAIMENIEIQKNEFKYECISAALAETGDEVNLICTSDNKRLNFTLPSSDEIEAFGLSLYREVTGSHVTDIIHYNSKDYKVTRIIKPDVDTQHMTLLRELSCLVNGVFHFSFLTDYFSYYISDYYNEVFNDNKIDDFVRPYLQYIAIKFKEQLLKIDLQYKCNTRKK